MERSFYITIPSFILNDTNISNNEVVLYGAICNLANENGYCFASNKFLSEMARISENTLAKSLTNLENRGYIKRVVIYKNNSSEVDERRIYISKSEPAFTPPQQIDPPPTIGDTSPEIWGYPPTEFGDTPIPKNWGHKNKDIKNKDNNILGDFVTDVTDGEIDEKTKSGTSQKDIDDFFEEVWSEYPNKKGKASVSAKTKKALFKLGKGKVLRAIERYKEYVASEHERGFDLQYKHGSSFFNSGYLDYIEEQSDAPPKSERAAPPEQSADNIVPFVSTTQELRRERYTETGERILSAAEYQAMLEAERIAKKRAALIAEGFDPDDAPFEL